MSARDILLQSFCLINIALAVGLCSGHLQVSNASAESGAQVRQEFPTLNIAEAAQRLVKGDALFVDARPFEAYKRAYIPNAVSLPMGEKPDSELLARLRQAPTLIVYCDGIDCQASEIVAASLRAMKFSNIVLMVEGINGWKEAGMPVDHFPE